MVFKCFSCCSTDPCVLSLRLIDVDRIPTDCPLGFGGGVFGVSPKWVKEESSVKDIENPVSEKAKTNDIHLL